MKFKFSRQVILVGALVVCICGVISWLTFRNVQMQASALRKVSHTQQEIDQVSQILSLLQDCETSSRGFVITNDEKFLEPFNKAIENLPARLVKIVELSSHDKTQENYTRELVSLANEKIRICTLSIRTRKEKSFREAIELVAEGSGKKNMDHVRSLVATILQYDNNLLQQSKIGYQQAVVESNNILLGTLVFCLLMLLFFIQKVRIYFKEKSRAEQELKESNERYNFVSKATSDVLWDWEFKTNEVVWGDNFDKLFGHSLTGTVTVAFWDTLVHPDDKNKVADSINRVIENGETRWQDEYRFLKSDGSYAYVVDKGVIIRDKAGNPYRMIGSMSDITDQKNTEFKIQQSEAKYRQIVETAQEGIWIVDHNYKSVFVNDKMCELLEYSFDEIISRDNTDFLDEEVRENVIKNRSKRVPGVNEQAEMKLRTKSGRVIWTSASITNNIDEKGNIVSIMAMMTDITNRKIAEEQLKRSEERLRLMVDNVKDYAIYVVDINGLISTWNSGAEEMKGYVSDEIIGKHISFFYTEEDKKNGLAESVLQQARENGSAKVEALMVKKDGSQFWADIVFNPIYDDAGKLYGFAKITRDVTEKKQSDKRLKEVSDRLSLATEVSNIGIWEWDLISNGLNWDDTCYRLFGVQKQEGSTPLNLMSRYVHPDDLNGLQEILTRDGLTDNRFQTNLRVILPNKTVRHIVTSGMVTRRLW